MKEYAFRLKYGDDIRLSIEKYCLDNRINTAIILSSVGSVYHARIRMAKAEKIFESDEDYEVLSLNGTISSGRAHLHIAVSDEDGHVIGGHLMEGCLINTTLEVVLGALDDYESHRLYDENTGYDEIVFERIQNESDY